MIKHADSVEAVRAQYRPTVIRTLFVGESAPHSGKFFYFGNTPMTRHMMRAIEAMFGKTEDFLATFKAYGWFLDDMVKTPVNQLHGRERQTACGAAINDLAIRIALYRPEAIVCLMRGIECYVNAAADVACSDVPRYSVPFPGNGQQGRFNTEISKILPKLPRNPVSPARIRSHAL